MRYICHLVILTILLVSALLPNVDTFTAQASSETAAPQVYSELTRVDVTDQPNRGNLAIRDSTPSALPTPMPLPLATPMPIDPDSTPLASPTPPAESVVSAPIPAPVASSAMVWPVAGSNGISQYFSAAHPAVDIYASCGTPVVAAFGGNLVQSGWKNNGGGKVVTVESPDGKVAEYNHLSGIAPLGPVIAPGQVVGYVGATGLATGCHLHFALIIDGLYQDALAFY